MIMGYEDTKQKILSTLMQRPNGTEIQPSAHQEFALCLLEYIRSVEMISASTLIGIAYEETVPVQSNIANGAYITGVSPQRIAIYENFRDVNGDPITVSTDDGGKIVILTWNKQYWSKQEISTNVISQSDEANFSYYLTIRKTYDSIASMNDDKYFPVGNNGKEIKRGEIVSVSNPDVESENAIYSYELNGDTPYWKFQTRLHSLESRTLDGGRADTNYGGATVIDCGGANQ